MRIALPKGRLLKESLAWLRSCGFPAPDPTGRSLTLHVGQGWVAIMVKGADVPVVVQNGAADLGIVGADVLEEDRPDVYDLCALGFGRCRLSLAAPEGFVPEAGDAPVRIATKYPALAEGKLASSGLWFRIIRVSSSAELAPALGLADAIVDIVDTGGTLAAHGLREIRILMPIEARLIANRRSYRFIERRFWE